MVSRIAWRAWSTNGCCCSVLKISLLTDFGFVVRLIWNSIETVLSEYFRHGYSSDDRTIRFQAGPVLNTNEIFEYLRSHNLPFVEITKFKEKIISAWSPIVIHWHDLWTKGVAESYVDMDSWHDHSECEYMAWDQILNHIGNIGCSREFWQDNQ